MTEIDDKQIREFFAGQKQEIADNGFSRRVMHSLPDRANRLLQLWSVFVCLVAAVLFFAFDGLQAILTTLREVFISMVQGGATSLDPKSLIIAVAVLMFLGVRKAWVMATR